MNEYEIDEHVYIFESFDHQVVMNSIETGETLSKIFRDGTIEGEPVDALFMLKRSHPWYAKLRTKERIIGVVGDHYALTFSRRETEDWMAGTYPTSEGWTSHSELVWTTSRTLES